MQIERQIAWRISMSIFQPETKSTAKVKKKYVVAEGFTIDGCKTCLFDGKTICREQILFGNKKHEVYTVNKHKIALTRDDDKRIVQIDGITTLARRYVAFSAQ